MMMEQSGDADESRQKTTGGIPQRGTAELCGVGICIPEKPARTQSAPASSTSMLCKKRRDAVVHR